MRRFLTALLCALLLSISVFANNVITEMKTDCTVQPNGVCKMTQTVTVNLDTLETELRLPLAKGAKKAQVAGFKARQYEEDGITVLSLESNTGITGSRTFTVTYELQDLVTEENEIQTLTLPLLCAKWEYPIQNYAFTVSMPQEFESRPTFLSGYRSDVIEDHMALQTRDLAITGTIRDQLKDRESLDMVLELPAGYFSGAYAKWSASWTATAFCIGFAVLALVYWFLKLRSKRIQVSPRALPPDSTPPGDVPFLLCGGKASFNMTVCHWASLGYLTISVNQKGNITLRKRMDMGNERRKMDQTLFAALFGGGGQCDGASLRYKRTAGRAIQVTPRFWARRLYKKTSGSPKLMQLLCALCGAVAVLLTMSMLLPLMTARWLVLIGCFLLGGLLSLCLQNWLAAWYLRSIPGLILAALSGAAMILTAQLGGGMGTMLLALALSLFTGWQTLHGGQRTRLGNQFIGQTLGFRRYLHRLTPDQARRLLDQDSQSFYSLLPYAQAMGLGAELAAKFDGNDLEPCDWYAEGRIAPRTSREFYTRWKETLAVLELSIHK